MKDEIVQVPLEKIDFRPQVREVFDDQLIAGLAANIEEIGQEYPVLLFKDGERFGIEDGERRCRALKSLGRKTVAAILKEKPSDAQLLLRQCSCDFQRQDLSPMEKASAMERLMTATDWNGKEVAARLGILPSMVTRLLALLTLPPEIRQTLKEGKIPASAGYELAKIEDAAVQAEMAGRLAAGRITRDGLAGARKAAKRPANGKPPVGQKRVTAMLGDGRAVTVCCPGDTIDDFIAVLEEVLSKARKGRSQGFALDTLVRFLRDQSDAA